MIMLDKLFSTIFPLLCLTLLVMRVMMTTAIVDNDDDDLAAAPESENLVKESEKKTHAVTATLNKMLKNYDKRIRPDFDGPPLDIGVTIFVKSLASVSEVDMEYKIDFYLRQYWKDGRLKFNLTRKRSGTRVEVIGIGHEFAQQIWQPDTFFPNEKKSYIHSATVLNEFIRLYYNGTVLKSTRLTLTASCPMNLVYFPMDQQNCSVELGSYGYSINEIMYNWFQGNSSVRIGVNSLTLPQFRVLGHRQNTRMSRTTTGAYKILICEFLLVRSLNYYLTQVYIPAALIVIISWFSLWMGRDQIAERMALGVTSVLTITTLLMSTNSNSPKISYIKALDIYLAICFTSVFASLFQSASIGYAFKKMKAGEAKREEKVRAAMAIFSGQQQQQHHQQHHHQQQQQRDSSVEAKRMQWRESLSFELDRGVADVEFQAGDGGVRVKSPQVNNHVHKQVQGSSYLVKIARVDIVARIIFPIFFSTFNIIYWIHYLNAMRWDLDDTWTFNGWSA